MRRMYSQKQIEALAKQVADYEIENAEIHLNQIVAGSGEQGIIYVGDDGETTFLPASSSDENKLVVIDDDGNPELASSFAESMSGYSLTTDEKENITINGLYCGAVKNGNKITFACSFLATRSGDVASDLITPYYFNIPTDVLNKLIPFTTGILSSIPCNFVNTGNVIQYKQIPCAILKTEQGIAFRFYGISGMSANTEYFVRVEATFLLSENLLPTE